MPFGPWVLLLLQKGMSGDSRADRRRDRARMGFVVISKNAMREGDLLHVPSRLARALANGWYLNSGGGGCLGFQFFACRFVV